MNQNITISIRTKDMKDFPQQITETEDRERRAEAVYSAIMFAAREARAAFENADDFGPACPLMFMINDTEGNKCGTLHFTEAIG